MLLCGLSWTRRAFKEEEPRKNFSYSSTISWGRGSGDWLCWS